MKRKDEKRDVIVDREREQQDVKHIAKQEADSTEKQTGLEVNKTRSLYSTLIEAGYNEQVASVTVRSFESFLSKAGYVSQLQDVILQFDCITKLMYDSVDQTLSLILKGTVASLEREVDEKIIFELNQTRQHLQETLLKLKHYENEIALETQERGTVIRSTREYKEQIAALQLQLNKTENEKQVLKKQVEEFREKGRKAEVIVAAAEGLRKVQNEGAGFLGGKLLRAVQTFLATVDNVKGTK